MELVLLKSWCKRARCLKGFKSSDVRLGRVVVGCCWSKLIVVDELIRWFEEQLDGL